MFGENSALYRSKPIPANTDSLKGSNPMTQDQLLNMKFYAQQLQESLAVAYWATTDHDKEWHTKQAIDHVNKILSIKESV